MIKYLTLTWDNSEQGVCADYYFAPVSSAEDMMRLGLRFIGLVKTVTKTILMNYLLGIEITEIIERQIGVVLKTNIVPTMM